MLPWDLPRVLPRDLPRVLPRDLPRVLSPCLIPRLVPLVVLGGLGVGSVGEEVVVGMVVEGVVVVVEGEVGFVGTQHCLHAAPTATQRKGLAFPFHGLQMERNACSNITVNSPAL